jgi:hypothetical protein
MDGESLLIVSVGVSEAAKLFIQKSLSPMDVAFRTQKSSDELARTLTSRGLGAGCVLIDSDGLEDNGRAYCVAARGVDGRIPILILSSEQDKNYYMDAIRWGATGFVMKPLKADALKVKLMECYLTRRNRNVETVSFDLERYLRGEFGKAEKGGYGLTFMLATLLLDDPAERDNAMSQTYYRNMAYENMKRLFGDTEAFVRLNFRYYLGVLPFCGKKEAEVFSGRLQAFFAELQRKNGLPSSVRLAAAFATYPDDAEKFMEVQRVLAERMRANTGGAELEWFN